MKTKRILSILLVLAMVLSLLPTVAFATGTTYNITNGTKEGDKDTNHGYITIDKATAAEGETVTITVNPASGYQLKSLTVVPVEYVEIGGVKWATKNLGAEKETDYGYYFAWGATELAYSSLSSNTFTFVASRPASYGGNGWIQNDGFVKVNTPHYDGSSYTKYNKSDSKTVLESSDDAATALLGSGWRMPTSAEFKALYDACGGSYDKTTNPSGASASVDKGVYWCTSYDGVAGYLFCDGTNKLFFPATGYGDKTTLTNPGTYGYYWSSTLESTGLAYYMYFNKSAIFPQNDYSCYYGRCVRPVKDAAPATITPEKQQGGTYQFTMPGCAVTIKAEFEKAAGPQKIGDSNVTWELTDSDTTLVLGGTGAMPDFTLSPVDTPWYSAKDTITTVKVGSGITRFGKDAFYGCENIVNLYIEDPESWCKIEFADSYSHPFCYNTLNHNLYVNGNPATDLVIPDTITEIKDYAFYHFNNLTSVTIPSSVTSIGESAFEGCTALTSITIPTSVTSIGDYAFMYCKGLTGVTIPKSVTSIGNQTFAGCTALTSVTIPTGVTSTGDYTFMGCTGLTSVTIPASVTSIGNSAFACCTALTSVTISSGVTSIGNRAFASCPKLTSVTIPSSVTEIGANAFTFDLLSDDGCDSLTTVTVKAITPPTLGIGAFPVSNAGFKAYVPYGTLTDYENAKVWKITTLKSRLAEAYIVDDKPTINGTVAISKDCFPSDTYTAANETVNVTVTPDEGYQLKSLKYNDGTDHDITNAKSFTMPLANVTLTAEFEKAAPAPTGNETELFNPQNAGVDNTWGEYDNPKATWNPATKELSIEIISQGDFQWGNQVVFDTGITTLDTTKEYQVSFTATASTVNCGGVSFKAFDDNIIAFANQNLPFTTTPFNYVSDWTTPSSASANGMIVFDFAWDPAQTVTITNISIKERAVAAPTPTKTPVTELELSVGDFTRAQLSSPPSDLVSITKITEGNEDITARPVYYYFLDKNGAMVYGYDTYSSAWMVYEDDEFKPLQGTPDYGKIATAVLEMGFDRKDSENGDFASDVTVKVNGGAALAKANDPLTEEGYKSNGDELYVFLRFDLAAKKDLTVKKGNADATEGEDYMWSPVNENWLIIKANGLTVSGTTTKEYIQVDRAVTDITIKDLSIDAGEHTALSFAGSDALNTLTVKGNNTLTSTNNYPLYFFGPGKITGDGNLSSKSTAESYGIYSQGTITLDCSGTITADGGMYGIYTKSRTNPIEVTENTGKVIVYGKTGALRCDSGEIKLAQGVNMTGSTTYQALEESITGAAAFGTTAADNVYIKTDGNVAKSVLIAPKKIPALTPTLYWGFDDSTKSLYLSATAEAITGKGATPNSFDATALYDSFLKVPWQESSGSAEHVEILNDIVPGSMTYWFNGMSRITEIVGIEHLCTSRVTSMANAFRQCRKLTSLDLSGFDTSNVTSMKAMFSTCQELTSLDLSGFDTSNVTDMSDMFYNSNKLTSLDLSGFNTAKVTTMSGMFDNCSELKSVNVSSFDTSNVTDMSNMFSDTALETVDLSKFNTAKVTTMGSMFGGCTKLKSLDLSKFNTSSLKSMMSMFDDCRALTSLDISSFNTSNIQSMISVFSDCTSLKKLDLSSFDMTNVISISSMFDNMQLTEFKTPKNLTQDVALPALDSSMAWFNADTDKIYEDTNLPKNSATSITLIAKIVAMPPEMPENVEVKNGKIKSGDSVVEVKTVGGTKIPSDKLQDVAEAINNTLGNKAVKEFDGSGIEAATSKNDSELKNALKALTQDKTAQANLESAGLSKRLEIELKGAEVSDLENPIVEKMTVVVTPVAIAKVKGSAGEVELKTTINDSDIEEKITVRMPINQKNDSKTAAVYDKDGKFLGNFEVKIEDGSKYVEFKAESAGEFTYITLNEKTAGATVNGTLYASVEDALSEITEGQTVELTKDVTEKVTVNKTGMFTINDNGHSIEIEAGKGLKLTKKDNTYTVEEIGSNTEMPKQTEVTPGGEIKSGDTVVDVKDSEGKSIPNEKKQAVATQINETLNNEAVEKFTKSGIEKAVEGKENELKDEMKSQSSDQTALANLERAELKTYLEMALKGAEVSNPEDPVVEKMTVEVTPVAVAKVQGSTGEVEFKTPINNSDIEEPITVRMPVDSKNGSKTAAVYDKDGKFLGNFPIKVEGGSKFVELETKTAGKFTYLTLNENTTGAKIGTKLYATAEDALSEISDGQTLNIAKDVQGNVTISKECSFTINDNGHTVNIVPGEGYILTKEGNTYTVIDKANATEMPADVKVSGGKIKSDGKVVDVKDNEGNSIPGENLQDVAEEINKTLDNKVVSEFTKSGLDGATGKNDDAFKSALKALTQDKTAQENLENAKLTKRLEIELKGAEVSDPENPIVEKMTVAVTPVAIAKVKGSTGEVELKTTINDSDIEGKITVRMPINQKNDSKTAAVYDKNGKFLGNFEVKIEDGSKYVEFKTESAGEFTYITLNGKTAGATVNGTLYASVEDALSEITDGQTVELTKDVTEKVTVNKTGTFTINDNGHSIEIEAGKGLKLTKKDNTYTVEEIGSNTEMPKQTEVTPGGEIKSGDTVVDVKDSEGKSIPNEKKQAVATQINKTLNNEAVEKFTKSGIEKAVEGKEEELKDEMKSQSSDQTALANLATAEIKTQLEMKLKSAEVDDPSNPIVEKMTIEVTPVAVAKVQGSTGEVEFKTAINDSDIEEAITVRMPVDSKNDSKTAAVYDKDGKFLGNFPIKVENGNKFVELETKTAGEFTYLTLNENTTGAKIGTKLYATAEDALSEISDGQTLNITKDVEKDIVLSQEGTFTINDNGYTVNIVPAEGYTLTKEGNTYTIFNKANVPEMPAEVEISGGKIKSDDKVVDVKDNEGNSIPRENLQAVADEINNTLDNKTVEEFTKNGLNEATKANDEELKNTLKASTRDKIAQANIENAKLTKRLEIELKGAEVSDLENPIVQRMTVKVTPVAVAKVQGSDGEVEVKTTIKDKDINDEIIVRMPVDSKNDSKTAAIYDKNGTFLGNYPVKIEDGNKFVEFETNTTGEMSYLTLNEKTSGASVDGTLYANAGDAVSEAKSGDTVTVTKDFKEAINVSKEITFDDVEGTHKVSVLPSIGYKYRQIDNKHIIEPGNRTETPEKLEVKSDIIKSGNTVVDVKDGEGKEIPNEKKQTVAEAINKVFENENFEKSSAVGIEKATVRKVSEIVKDLKEKTSDTVARNNITEKSVNKYLTVSLVSAGIKSASDVVVESMVLEVTPMATVTVKGRNGEVVTVTSPIANEEINGTVKFNLPIDIRANAELVAVYHEDEFVGNRPVLEDENKNQYVEVETDSFSPFSYVVLNEKNAAASINGKLYLTLSDAIKEVKDNEEIKLLKDVTETVTVEREVSFAINPNGKTNNATIIPGEKFNKLPQSGNSFKVEAIGKPEMPKQTEVTPGGDIKSGDNVVEVKGENGESIPDDKKPAVVEEINNTLDNKAVKSFNQSGLEKATARSDSKLEQALKSQTTDPTALENLEKAELTKYLEVELKKVDVNDPSNPVVESMTVDVKAMASAKVEGTNGEIELKTPISSESIKEEIVVRMPVSGNNNSDTAALYDENGTFLGNYEVKEENGNKYIEFKTKNVGEFTYRTINEKNSGASINGTLYASVEDALSEIIDGQTVNITKDVKENITISHEGTFTVNDNGHTVNIVAGNGYTLKKNGNTYTITKKSSGGSGGVLSYTIKFETNGGNTLKNVSVSSGQTIGTIETPVKEGFVFDGWFSDKELTKPYNADDKVTKSTTLYAKWKVDPVRQITLTIGKKEATVFTKEMVNDVAPKIVNDRTMLPIRFIAEALGATVDWNGEKELVTISNEGLKIEITIGKDVAFVNGNEVKLDSPAFIENDRTYLPLRFVAENLGAEVEWVEEAQQVVITK